MIGPGMMYECGFGGFSTFSWIGMIINLVITIGLIVGIVLLIVWLVRRFNVSEKSSTSSYGQSNVQPTPREILQSRYARGEINRDEFQQILADIN